jgi:regulator of sirC expression with transglutaminase-like and TPR domain
VDSGLKAFAEVIRAPEPGMDLARAALHIARIEYPSLAIDPYVDELNTLALRSHARVPDDPLHRLHRLREFLFEEERFRGNEEDYFDPRNSCLNDVLDRRVGIPITLSLVLIEVGRRVGLPVDGIGLPGHFVVGVDVGEDRVLLDPFNGGAMLTHDACSELAARAIGRRMMLKDEHFAPVTKAQYLVRMLNNLKAIYCKQEAWPKALAVIDRLMLLHEAPAAELRDRGTVLMHLGECWLGIADWERYLTQHPAAPDVDAIRRRLRRVRQALSSLN